MRFYWFCLPISFVMPTFATCLEIKIGTISTDNVYFAP